MQIITRSKLYYTASGIVTLCTWPYVAQVVRRLKQFDLLMMSTQCSKHVEAFKKLIIKQHFVQQVG